MDKYIEIMAFYWADWVQTAIVNTRYSVVLAAFAFFVGYLIVTIIKRGKVTQLIKKISQGQQQLEQFKNQEKGLLNQQKKDAEQVAELQKQLEKSSADVQQEKSLHQENILTKESLFSALEKEKNQEIERLNTVLSETKRVSEQLKNELNAQQSSADQYAEVQGKMAEMERQVGRSAAELIAVKQQLSSEVSHKNELVEQLDKPAELGKNQQETALIPEFQLEPAKDMSEASADSELAIEGAKLNPPAQELSQQDESSLEVIDGLVEEPTRVVESVPAELIAEEDLVIEVLDSVVVVEEVNELTVDNDNTVSDLPINQPSVEVEPLLTQPEPIGVVNKAAEIKARPRIRPRPRVIVEVEDEYEVSFSGRLADVADKMDGLQAKMKGFFGKKKS